MEYGNGIGKWSSGHLTHQISQVSDQLTIIAVFMLDIYYVMFSIHIISVLV